MLVLYNAVISIAIIIVLIIFTTTVATAAIGNTATPDVVDATSNTILKLTAYKCQFYDIWQVNPTRFSGVDRQRLVQGIETVKKQYYHFLYKIILMVEI